MQKNIEHAVVRRLTAAEEAQKEEEEEFKAMKEKLIQKQKAVTGDNEDSDREERKSKQFEQSQGQKNQGPAPSEGSKEGGRKRSAKEGSDGIKKKILRKK